MKAVVYTKYGKADVLNIKELETPQPKAHELLVKVYATTFNRSDCAIVSGPLLMRLFTGLFKPQKPVPGTDFAGEVVEVGSHVTTFKKGDKVFGFDDMGLASMAQYMTIGEDKNVSIMPEGITYAQATASLEAAHYALNFVNKVPLKAGDKVMVHGATGGIGSAVVQILKHQGAYVTATCRTEHQDLVKALGAERVIDYTSMDFTKDQESYEFVFDAVGKSTFGKCKPLLKEKGIYISSELGPGAQNPFLALITPILGGKKVKFPIPFDIKASILTIKDLIEKGKFKPLIDRHYPLEKVAEAYTYTASGQKVGNVIIDIQD